MYLKKEDGWKVKKVCCWDILKPLY